MTDAIPLVDPLPICIPACWTETRCPRCGMPIPPTGRSVPLEAANSYCACEGSRSRRHLWDEHDDARSYTDPEGWRQHVAVCAVCKGADQ